MQHGESHHAHLRRRARRPHSVEHAFPSSNLFIHRLDTTMLVVGIVGPLVSMPQLIEIYVRQNVAGISVPTWIGYTALTALWLFYGLVHRERPIIITQTLWLLVNLSVVFGVLAHG